MYASIYGYSIAKYDLATGGYLGGFDTGSDIPEGLAFDAAGNLYSAFADSNTITRVAADGTTTLFASDLHGPRGLAFDISGNLLVASWDDGAVRKVTPNGNVSIFASGMGPLWGLAVDSLGNAYATSPGFGKLYKITASGAVSTLRSSFYPLGVATDGADNVFLADDYTTVVKITPGGTVSTYTTGGPYPGAGFFRPSDLLVTANGTLLIASDGSGIYKADAPGPATLLASTGGTPLFLAINPVPEPGTIGLLLVGALGVLHRRCGRRERKFLGPAIIKLRRFTFVPIALAAVALAPTAHAQVITVGPNINVTKLSGSQSETAIAISRTNPSLIALSSNAQGTMINKFSTNGGSTWSNSALQVAGGYDSWMGGDTFGNIFLSYQVSGLTKVARSIDGGATYSVTAIPGSGADHPEMAVGPGLVLGTTSIFLRDTTSSSRIISATSTGLGTTSAYTVQNSMGAGNFGSSAVGPGGKTVFTVMNPSGGIGPANMAVRYDADGTGPGGYVLQSTLTTNVGGFRPVPAQPNRTIDTQVALQYDFSGGANNGTLYALYTQAANTSTNDTNIVFRRSTDNGVTFSSEVRLNNDAGTNSQFFGRLAVDQTTGCLASVWYDARNSPGNNMVELWGTVSIDGGTTWAPNFKISGGISDGRQSNTGDPNEFGDYISMDFYNGNLVTAWADSSNFTADNPNGTTGLDIYFAKIQVAVPEPSTCALTALGLLAFGVRARRGAS